MGRHVKETVIRKVCVRCKQSRGIYEYYSCPVSTFFPDGKVSMCKRCIKEMLNPNDIDSVVAVLKQMNRPFIKEIWESKLSAQNPLGEYLRATSLGHYRNMQFNVLRIDDDDDNEEEKTKDDIEEEIKSVDYSEDELNSLKKKWGKDYSPSDLEYLEKYERNMKNDYELTTTSHRDYLSKICRLSLQMDKIMLTEPDKFVKLSNVYNDMMKAAKFQQIQRTEADRTGGLDTFGQLFEKIEKEGFIPKWHTDEPQDIVDKTIQNLNEFTKKLVLGESNLMSLVESTMEKIKNVEDDEDDDISQYQDAEDELDKDFELEDEYGDEEVDE